LTNSESNLSLSDVPAGDHCCQTKESGASHEEYSDVEAMCSPPVEPRILEKDLLAQAIMASPHAMNSTSLRPLRHLRTRSGASHEDRSESELKGSPQLAHRILAQELQVPSPQIGSDASSTAVGSASSSAQVMVTPLSFAWDADVDDLAGHKMLGSISARASEPLVSSSTTITCLAAALAEKERAASEAHEHSAGNIRIQQDLHWKLELERHHSAALSFELDRRSRESKDLRKQLEEAESKKAETSGCPRYATAHTQIIATPGSMHMAATVPLPGNVAIVSGSVQHGAVVHTTTTSTRRGQVVSTSRTSSSSPLRMQRASYCGGLQHAAAKEGLTSCRSTAPLQRSGSQPGCRFHTVTSTVVGVQSPRLMRQCPARTLSTKNLLSTSGAASRAPPLPMVPGVAAEKAIANLREELQSWVNSVV
jgi:hypothetical protein